MSSSQSEPRLCPLSMAVAVVEPLWWYCGAGSPHLPSTHLSAVLAVVTAHEFSSAGDVQPFSKRCNGLSKTKPRIVAEMEEKDGKG